MSQDHIDLFQKYLNSVTLVDAQENKEVKYKFEHNVIIDRYGSTIEIKKNFYTEIQIWPHDNIGESGVVWEDALCSGGFVFSFRDAKDATFFALKWGNR